MQIPDGHTGSQYIAIQRNEARCRCSSRGVAGTDGPRRDPRHVV